MAPHICDPIGRDIWELVGCDGEQVSYYQLQPIHVNKTFGKDSPNITRITLLQGGGCTDLLTKQFEEENAGIIAAFENLGRDNLFDESLATLDFILEGGTELTELQNALPPESNDFIELNNVNFHNPENQCVLEEERRNSDVELECSGEIPLPVITTVSVTPVPLESPTSTVLVKTELGSTLNFEVVDPLATSDPLSPLHSEQNGDIDISVSTDTEDDEANKSIAISSEDLETSFNKRSCKIVLTRCDNANTDGGITRWKLKSNFVNEEEKQERELSQQHFQNSDFPQTNWSKETDEAFVASVLRTPQTNSPNPFLTNPMLSTDEAIASNATDSSPINEIKKKLTASSIPSPTVKRQIKRSQIRKQFQVHQNLEEKKKYLMEQNKLMRAVAGGFQCIPCGKKFENRWNLVVHVRIHTGERPFKCPDCDLTFRQLAHAQKHARKVHQREVCRAEVDTGGGMPPLQKTLKTKTGKKKLGRPRKDSLVVTAPGTGTSSATTSSQSLPPVGNGNEVSMASPRITPSTVTKVKNGYKKKDVPNSAVTTPANENQLNMPEYLSQIDLDKQSPSKGCIRIIHPETETIVDVQKNLLISFLRPFLEKQGLTSPATENNSNSENVQNTEDLDLVEVHSKLRDALNSEIGDDTAKKRGPPKGYKRKKISLYNGSTGTDGDRTSGESEDDERPKIRSYRCKTCGAKYPCIAHLRVHMRTHLNMNNKPVDADDEGHNQPSKILSSILQNAKVKRGDSINDEYLSNGTDISVGKLESKRKGKFKCVRCNNYYANVYNLHRHKMNSCPFKGSTRKVIKKPVQQINTEPMSPAPETEVAESPCTQIEAQIKSEPMDATDELVETDLPANTTTCTKPKKSSPSPKHTCNQCGKNFSRKIEMLAHIRAQHPINKPRFKCNQCNIAFKTEEMLSIHVTAKHAPKKISLNKTNSNSSESQDQKRVSCDLCGKTFCRKDVLRNHIKLHTGEKPYKCNLCGEAFLRPQSLKSHEARHTGDKPYKCDQPDCDVAFFKAVSIKRHREKEHGILD